jgi:phospholipase A-2-activating protein
VDALIGHSLNVCTLSYSATCRKLISGSWDHTARIWSRRGAKWEVELVLDGHDEAVWGVAIVEAGPSRGCFLTGSVHATGAADIQGSADRLVNLWSSSGELMLSIKGSPEPVRSLAVLPESTHFASACNDG